MYSVLDDVLMKKIRSNARSNLANVDETPDFKLLWIEENIPLAYKEPLEMYMGFKAAARADTFLSMVKRRQDYIFWSYASDMMSFGVCAAKPKVHGGYVRYQFPMYLMRMSRSKGVRSVKNSLALKLGEMCHMSSYSVKQDLLPFFIQLYRSDLSLQVKMALELELEDEEIAFLMNDKIDSPAVKRIVNECKKPLDIKDGSKVKNEGSKQKIPSTEPMQNRPTSTAPNQKSLFQY